MTPSTHLYPVPSQELRQSGECCPTESFNPPVVLQKTAFPVVDTVGESIMKLQEGQKRQEVERRAGSGANLAKGEIRVEAGVTSENQSKRR